MAKSQLSGSVLAMLFVYLTEGPENTGGTIVTTSVNIEKFKSGRLGQEMLEDLRFVKFFNFPV